MKTKLLLLAILFAITTTSCTKETSGGGGNENDAIYYTGYLVNSYIEGFSSVIGCYSYDDGLPENTIILLGFAAEGTDQYMGSSNKEFKERANKNGEYGTYEDWTYIGENNSFSLDIYDIKIWAANDYNENYPAGSNLTDIARATYSSFQPFIDNGYETIMPDMELYAYGGLPRLGVTDAPNTYPYYNVELPQNGENIMDLPSVSSRAIDSVRSHVFASISFLEAPTTTTPQFEVSVTLEDGTVVSGSFEIELELSF